MVKNIHKEVILRRTGRKHKHNAWVPEMKASVSGKRFFTGVFLLAGTIIVLAGTYRSYLIGSGGSIEGPAWRAAFICGISSERTLLFLPLFVPLAAAGNVQEELKSRYALFLVSRAGRGSYLAAKALGVAVSGGLTVIAAYMAALAVIIPWCACIPDLSYPAATLSLVPALVCGFLNGAFWALAGSGAAVLTRNQYLGYAVPFILYYVLTAFQERYYAELYILSPRQWAYPSYFGTGVCAGVLLVLMAAAALLLLKLTERRLTG